MYFFRFFRFLESKRCFFFLFLSHSRHRQQTNKARNFSTAEKNRRLKWNFVFNRCFGNFFSDSLQNEMRVFRSQRFQVLGRIPRRRAQKRRNRCKWSELDKGRGAEKLGLGRVAISERGEKPFSSECFMGLKIMQFRRWKWIRMHQDLRLLHEMRS